MRLHALYLAETLVRRTEKRMDFRKRQLTNRGECGIIFRVPSEYGGMAQSVEHIVHIDGVVGSSPTVTTTSASVERLRRFFLL